MQAGDVIGFKIPSGPHAGQIRPAMIARATNEEAQEFDLFVIGVPGDGPEYYPPQIVANRRRAQSDSDVGWTDLPGNAPPAPSPARPLAKEREQKQEG